MTQATSSLADTEGWRLTSPTLVPSRPRARTPRSYLCWNEWFRYLSSSRSPVAWSRVVMFTNVPLGTLTTLSRRRSEMNRAGAVFGTRWLPSVTPCPLRSDVSQLTTLKMSLSTPADKAAWWSRLGVHDPVCLCLFYAYFTLVWMKKRVCGVFVWRPHDLLFYIIDNEAQNSHNTVWMLLMKWIQIQLQIQMLSRELLARIRLCTKTKLCNMKVPWRSLQSSCLPLTAWTRILVQIFCDGYF